MFRIAVTVNELNTVKLIEGQIVIDITKLRQELIERKVSVYNAGQNSWRSIPVALTPTIVSKSEWRSLENDALVVMNAFRKVNCWLNQPDQSHLRRKIHEGLSAFEKFFLDTLPEDNWGHVTIRMDLYWHFNEIQIIEVNCTIPAMQAYSDNVFAAWKTFSKYEVTNDYQSKNMEELLHSLLAMYRWHGGHMAKPSIVILHREGDSQLGELLSLQKSWSNLGLKTVLATPEALTRVGDVWLVDGVPYDLVYRHIFAWRLAGTYLAEALRTNQAAHIYNPISAHFESKAFLALTSQMAHDARLQKLVDFSIEEVGVIQKRVPWSRILGSGSDQMESIDFRDIESRLTDLVIKRSIGYGGHQVIMGSDWGSLDVQKNLCSLTGSHGPVSFRDFSVWVQEHDTSLWIAQKRLSGAQRETLVLVDDKVETWNAWYDASIFINTKTPPICRGGVSRIAKSAIVNIGTGGGLAPFIVSDAEQAR